MSEVSKPHHRNNYTDSGQPVVHFPSMSYANQESYNFFKVLGVTQPTTDPGLTVPEFNILPTVLPFITVYTVVSPKLHITYEIPLKLRGCNASLNL